MYRTKKRHNQGFTLIELLVVIAIIGVLSSVVLASLNSARAKSRDAKRLSDLRQIQNALELHFTDKGYYPNTGGSGSYRSECYGSAPEDVIPGLVPTYISSLPADPTMDKVADTSCYLYTSDGTDYALLDHVIVDTNFSYLTRPTFFDPTRDGGSSGCVLDGNAFWSWKVSSPGGVCW